MVLVSLGLTQTEVLNENKLAELKLQHNSRGFTIQSNI